MIKKFEELFIKVGVGDTTMKNKISSVWTFLVHKSRNPVKAEEGYFELLHKSFVEATGEYELIKRPIISDGKVEYKRIQILGAKFKVEPKIGSELQINLYNIKSFKKGCGSLLIENIIKWAKETNRKSIWLDVLKNNEKAIGLYKKYGFEIDTQYDKLANVTWYRMYKLID